MIDKIYDKKRAAIVGTFYLLVPIIANFLVLLVSLAIDFPIPENDEYKIWITFLETHSIISTLPTFFSFVIPFIFCLIYILPIFRRKENAKFHAVNVPIVFATLGVLGWLLMLAIQFGITVYIHLSFGQKIYGCLKNSAVFTLLSAVLAFVISFLILETVNRAKILRLYFPDGKISQSKNLIHTSIKFNFITYYIGFGIFPVVVLLFALLTKEKNLGIDISWNLLFLMLAFLIVGIFITLLFANIFRKPLKDLTSVAEKISHGNFNQKAQVSSGDEIGILGDTFNEMATSLSEKEFMKDVFGKIVTPNVRDHLLGGKISLGGESVRATILFCDIRGFTSLSEKMECEKVVRLLNHYFTKMSVCIERNNGIINKYIGDAIMAIFGAPIKSDTHARDAYLAALEMQNALKNVNAEFSEWGFPEIKFGIGIHTGIVLAGNIGSASRMEYTVIGDAVNVASRIEGLCKEYKCSLLLSESTFQELNLTKENFIEIPEPKFLCDCQIRGKKESVRLYSCNQN